jgi:hypothetical protein
METGTTAILKQMAEVAIMEQIAIYMTALPCPPLPVIIIIAGEKRKITTSHEILAGLLKIAMIRDDPKLNEIRRKKQLDITDRIITELELIGEQFRGSSSGAAAAAYKVCEKFTAEYILAFDDIGCAAPSVMFVPMSDVPKHSSVHYAACSWHAAQEIMHAPAKPRTAEHFKKMEFSTLIEEHLLRVTAI